jgi:hypothetical protein
VVGDGDYAGDNLGAFEFRVDAGDSIAAFFADRLLSPSSMLRSAAQRAYILLSSCRGGEDLVARTVIPVVVQTLSGGDLLTISPADASCYLNPHASIAAGIAAAEVPESEIKLTNADRKKDTARSSRRGQFGSDVLEDDDWAEKLKQEKLKKMNQAKAGGYTSVEERVTKEVCKHFVLDITVNHVLHPLIRLTLLC